jgi:hypothetical protein
MEVDHGVRRLLELIRLRTPLKDEKGAEFPLSQLPISRRLAGNAVGPGKRGNRKLTHHGAAGTFRFRNFLSTGEG